jgi:polyisoprenoid-binding protein YceI
MTLRPLLVTTALLGSVLLPSARAQTVLPAQSEIGFVSTQMGVPVEGKFTKWTAQIQFDPRQADKGSVSFAIDTASARFGAPETDAELPKAAWFNTAKYPQASFQSASIKASGGGHFEVRGKLTIKGQTQDVAVPVAVVQSGATSTASGSFTIKRLAYKIGEGEWTDTTILADEVQVRFKLALTGMAPL